MGARSVLMLVRSDVAHDARVLREAATLAREGYRVSVLGIWAGGLARREVIDGVEVLRPRSRLAHSLLGRRTTVAASAARANPSSLRRWLYALASSLDGTLFALRAALAALRRRPQVVHAHDLNVLPAAWLISRACRARLVYDSHEVHLFSVGMLRLRPRAWRALCRRVEGACARGADAVITVNQACARAIARIHRIARPLVVHNTPRLAEAGRAPVRGVREAAGAGAAEPLAVYCGGLLPERGIEQAIDALALAPEMKLALLGFGDAGYRAALERRAAAGGVGARLVIVPPVAPHEVTAALRGADLGLVLTQDGGLNQRFSLPNKLIESVHAGVPVVATDLPEIRRVVRAYGCGLVVDARDPAAIAAAMRQILGDAALSARMRAGARAAALRLNWETEEQELLRAYRPL